MGGDPWGDEDLQEYLLTKLCGMDPDTIDIDLDRGPRPGAPYIEQQASTPIYIGEFLEKKSRLNIIIKFLSWQSRHKISDIAMDKLFQALHDEIVPKGKDFKGVDIVNNMPRSRAEARKVIREVGLDYIVIDACPCDETLYYGDRNGELQQCPHEKCGLSRYRTDMKSQKVPRKKMHYFPIGP